MIKGFNINLNQIIRDIIGDICKKYLKYLIVHWKLVGKKIKSLMKHLGDSKEEFKKVLNHHA